MSRPQRFIVERRLHGTVTFGEIDRDEVGRMLRGFGREGAIVLPDGAHCFTVICPNRTVFVAPLEVWNERNAPSEDELEHDAAAARAWWYA